MYSINTPEGFKAAMEWTANQLNRLNENGRWEIPRSGVTYTVKSHARKELIVSGNRHLEEGTERVIRALGWTLFEETATLATGSGKTQSMSRSGLFGELFDKLYPSGRSGTFDSFSA